MNITKGKMKERYLDDLKRSLLNQQAIIKDR